MAESSISSFCTIPTPATHAARAAVTSLAIIRAFGVEPSDCAILALKSSVHFRADFAPIAERVLVAAAPGPVVADPSTLPFKHLRPGLRLRA